MSDFDLDDIIKSPNSSEEIPKVTGQIPITYKVAPPPPKKDDINKTE